jgi:hypothetical protein
MSAGREEPRPARFFIHRRLIMRWQSIRTSSEGVCPALIVLAILSAFIVGCSGEHPRAQPAEAFPVHGTITFPDGTPLRGGMLYFSPTDAEDRGGVRYEAASLIDAKGHGF